MLHRRILTLWIVLIVVLAAVESKPAAADVWVNQLTLSRHGVFTELTVRAPGRVLCNHFIEEPKYDKPFRIVIDLCGAIHRLDQKIFADIPTGAITRIRTSQYATTPQNVVRVVLDLAREVTYKVDINNDRIVIALVTPDEPGFETWMSAPGTDGQAVERASAAQNVEPAPLAQTTPDVAPIRGQQTIPPAISEQPVVEEVSIQVEETSETEERVAPVAATEKPVPPPVQYGTPAGPAQTQAPMSDAKSTHEPAPSPGPEETAEQAVIESPRVQPVVQYATPIGPAGPVETPLLADDTEKPGAPEQVLARDKIEAEQPEIIAEKSEDVSLIERMRRKFFGASDGDKAAAEVAMDSAALNRIRELSGGAEPAVPGQEEELAVMEETPATPVDRAELESKIASVDPSAVFQGSAYAAAERNADGAPITAGKGKLVPIEPKRKEIEYERAGRRDPFNPLVEGLRSGLWTAALPRVDALRLVGILRDYDGSLALFEDMEGYGYILREGDQVKRGYLKAIGENRAVFEVDDYGWVHTVVLELREEGTGIDYDYADEYEGE